MDLWLLIGAKKVFLNLIHSHKCVKTATFGKKSILEGL